MRFSKKSYYLLGGLWVVFLIGMAVYFSSTSFRNLASFSDDEIEYAEDFLLGEEVPDDSKVTVPAYWEEDLKREQRRPNTLEQRLENELQGEYDAQLLKELKKRKNKSPKKTNLDQYLEDQGQQFFDAGSEEIKKELAKTLVENARADGYEVILDENYEVLSTKKIPVRGK